MKKSPHDIVRRTRGRDTGGAGDDALFGEGGNDRMRWRLIAANDETAHVWRVAA